MSAMQKQFSVGAMADEKLQEMLTLYKSPATIRDLKQVFFYISADANITIVSPLQMRFNVSANSAGQGPTTMYYAPIGTTRQFNIIDKINDLLDIRVPKDKYVIEINLAECAIESDPSGWQKIPDRVIFGESPSPPTVDWYSIPTFNKSDGLAGPTGTTPPVQSINTAYQQASKLTAPQTLYVRIKELANGEPYNWSVTNSGAYSIDKSHQLLVRHGDIDVTNLTLEFGHLIFTGDDYSYESEIVGPTSTAVYKEQNVLSSGIRRVGKLTDDKMYYRNYRYLDYNQEYFNTITSSVSQDPWYDPIIANFYKGADGVDYNPQEGNQYVGGYKIIPCQNLTQPSNRPPYYTTNLTATVGDPPDSFPLLLQGKPILYNQQVSKLGFRFLIKIISLF